MRKHVAILFVVSGLVAAAPAQAQTPEPRPARPYRGLFGGGVGNAEQLLKLNASAATGYDDDILAGETGSPGVPIGNTPGGTFARGAAALDYSLTRTKVSFTSTGAVATTYLPNSVQSLVTSYDGSVGGSAQVAKRTNVSGSYGMSRQPLYFFQPTFTQVFDLIFGEVVLYDQDNRKITERRVMTHGSAGVSHELTRRLRASGQVGFDQSTTSLHSQDFASRTMGGGLSYSLAKGLDLRVGYGVSDGRYDELTGDDRTIRTHTINAGVDYNKALSFSRNTTLAFATGTSALNDGTQTHYVLTGHVNVNRELGRTWSAQGGYSRDVSYIDVVRVPVLTDSATGGVSGMMSRKVQISAGVGASRGNAGFVTANNSFTTFYGSVNLRIGLTRNLGLSVVYARYQYLFDVGVSLTPGVPSRSDRQMLRASLDFWEPIFYRARRANASR